MGEETTFGGGFRQTPRTIEQMLSDIRELLEMDVVFVSAFAGDRLLLGTLEGKPTLRMARRRGVSARRLLLLAGARRSHLQRGPRRVPVWYLSGLFRQSL